MKRLFAIVLCLCMLLTFFVACNDEPETPAEADYKLGMGVVVSMDSSKTGLAQVDATVATVVTDAEGKIVACRIDVAQNKFDLTKDFAAQVAQTFKTKMEKGTEYGMAGKVDNDGNGVMLEWDAQTKEFEKYVVGKTAAEVKAIQTQEKNGHLIAVDEALLNAGCSMQITDFMAAVAAACEDAQGVAFKAVPGTFTLGVAANTAAADSTAVVADDAATEADETADALIAMYTDFAASVVVDGKIVASINDAIQPKINANADGEITAKAYTATKRNLKEGYNMAKYGAQMDWNGDGKVLEWYLQSAEFSKFVVGKTAAEVSAMATKVVEGSGYVISADDALLTAGCTIQITGIKAVVAESVTNAR